MKKTSDTAHRAAVDRLPSEPTTPWRCMYCGDVLLGGRGCNKQPCIDRYNATAKRMGVDDYRVRGEI